MGSDHRVLVLINAIDPKLPRPTRAGHDHDPPRDADHDLISALIEVVPLSSPMVSVTGAHCLTLTKNCQSIVEVFSECVSMY
jgi:hypothetical protein